jgi:hypothetical protein
VAINRVRVIGAKPKSIVRHAHSVTNTRKKPVALGNVAGTLRVPSAHRVPAHGELLPAAKICCRNPTRYKSGAPDDDGDVILATAKNSC